MNDIDDIRRANMLIIEYENDGPTGAARRCHMSLAQWSNLRDGVKDSKTGKRRGMRKETANKIATLAGKLPGWLDIYHPVTDVKKQPTVCEATVAEYKSPPSRREREIDEINILIERTDDRGLAVLLDKARDVAREYPLLKQTPASFQ